MSLALEDQVLTTGPSGKSSFMCVCTYIYAYNSIYIIYSVYIYLIQYI